jgi:hypothetical protein
MLLFMYENVYTQIHSWRSLHTTTVKTYVKNAAIIRGREYTGDYSTVTLINIQPLTAQ